MDGGGIRRIGVLALVLVLACAGCGRAGAPGPSATAAARPAETSAPPAPSSSAEPGAAQEPGPAAEPSPSPATGPSAASSPSPEPLPPAELPEGYDQSQCVPQSEPVEDDFFADAAFIGDSRMDGFRLYSGLKQGDFIVKAGLSVFELDEDLVRFGDEKLTVLDALGRKQYGKVYLSLGINELGMYDDQGYYDHYAKLIDDIRAQQPGADIYIQLLTPVNEKKCGENKIAYYITNQQIEVYNGLLRQLAMEKPVYLLDPAQALVDETGQPPYDSVTDGVHFTKETYAKWLGYLKCHTAQRGERDIETTVEAGFDSGSGPEPGVLPEGPSVPG